MSAKIRQTLIKLKFLCVKSNLNGWLHPKISKTTIRQSGCHAILALKSPYKEEFDATEPKAF